MIYPVLRIKENDMEWSCLTAEQLLDYFSNKWLPEQAAAIERHISKCDKCAGLAKEVRETDLALEQLSVTNLRKHSARTVSERTDQEIYAAWLRQFRRKLAESKEPDKPVIGCMCHLMSLRELVGHLEKLVSGEKIDMDHEHGLGIFVDTSTMREVARRNGKDPVDLIDEQGEPFIPKHLLGTRIVSGAICAVLGVLIGLSLYTPRVGSPFFWLALLFGAIGHFVVSHMKIRNFCRREI